MVKVNEEIYTEILAQYLAHRGHSVNLTLASHSSEPQASVPACVGHRQCASALLHSKPAGRAPDMWHGLIALNWNFQFCLQLVPLCRQSVWYQPSSSGRKKLFGHGYYFLKCRIKRDQQDVSVKYLVWTFLFICSFMHSQLGVSSWSIWLLSCTECRDSKEGIPVDS